MEIPQIDHTSTFIHCLIPQEITTNIAPENGWLVQMKFPMGARPIFREYATVIWTPVICNSRQGYIYNSTPDLGAEIDHQNAFLAPAHETWRWRLKFSQQTWQQKNTWLKVLDASSRFERERPLNKRFNGVVHDDMPRKNIKWVSWENEGAWVWNYLQDSPAAWFFSIHHHINWCLSNFYNVFQNPVFSQINLHQ